jgi:single-stranded DNA-specific DHH superfamily exonuclease
MRKKENEMDIIRKPKAETGDVIHTLTKAGLSAIPVIGGPAAEIFSAVIVPPLTKRRDEWIESIADGLIELEENFEGFKIENLSRNDMFITTVMYATQVAIRNHQKEKLEALRNAVLNSALPNAPEEDLQLTFLNLIDTFTSWHLRILKFFDNPQEWSQKRGIKFREYLSVSLAGILGDAFPEIKGKREFYDQIAKDLYMRGLMKIDNIHIQSTSNIIYDSFTTSLGKQFLQFIESPIFNNTIIK